MSPTDGASGSPAEGSTRLGYGNSRGLAAARPGTWSETSAQGNEGIGVAACNGKAVPYGRFLLIIGVTAECQWKSWPSGRPN